MDSHICPLYKVIETQAGELLGTLVGRDWLKEGEARHCCQPGVECCQRNMVVHRGFKPVTLLLDDPMNINILNVASNIMRDGHIFSISCGGRNHAAPQVISGKLYAEPEVDVGSCGAILPASLFGSLPWDNKNIPILFKKIKSKKSHGMPSYSSQGALDLFPRCWLLVDPLKRMAIPEIGQRLWFDARQARYPAVMQRVSGGVYVNMEMAGRLLTEMATAAPSPAAAGLLPAAAVIASFLARLRAHGTPAPRLLPPPTLHPLVSYFLQLCQPDIVRCSKGKGGLRVEVLRAAATDLLVLLHQAAPEFLAAMQAVSQNAQRLPLFSIPPNVWALPHGKRAEAMAKACVYWRVMQLTTRQRHELIPRLLAGDQWQREAGKWWAEQLAEVVPSDASMPAHYSGQTQQKTVSKRMQQEDSDSNSTALLHGLKVLTGGEYINIVIFTPQHLQQVCERYAKTPRHRQCLLNCGEALVMAITGSRVRWGGLNLGPAPVGADFSRARPIAFYMLINSMAAHRGVTRKQILQLPLREVLAGEPVLEDWARYVLGAAYDSSTAEDLISAVGRKASLKSAEKTQDGTAKQRKGATPGAAYTTEHRRAVLAAGGAKHSTHTHLAGAPGTTTYKNKSGQLVNICITVSLPAHHGKGSARQYKFSSGTKDPTLAASQATKYQAYVDNPDMTEGLDQKYLQKIDEKMARCPVKCTSCMGRPYTPQVP